MPCMPQNKFALSQHVRQHARSMYIKRLLQKVDVVSTFCNNFSQPATTSFVAGQVWFVGGNTRNIAVQLFL